MTEFVEELGEPRGFVLPDERGRHRQYPNVFVSGIGAAIPSRNINRSAKEAWVHRAKMGFARYSLRKIHEGEMRKETA